MHGWSRGMAENQLYDGSRMHLWWYCSKRYLQYEKIASLWSLSSFPFVIPPLPLLP